MSTIATATSVGAGSASRRFDPGRLATGIVLGAWAFLFWFVLASGRTSLYLSTRTRWLVPLGGVILTAAALGRLWSCRVEAPEPLSRREGWMLGGIALPVVILLASPPVTLGAYSASRRSSFSSSAIGATARSVTGPLDFVDVGAAQSFDAAMKQLAGRAGEEIDLQGFVTTDPGMEPDEFVLTRYIVTCCVADATVARVHVVGVPPGQFHADDWLEVTGRVYPVGRDVLVAAESVVPIPVPSQPYLTP
jgi:putative membrane protein